MCVYTKSFTHTHHNIKSGYFWVNGLWVAASLPFSLFSSVSIVNVITFIIRSKDKVHTHTHTHTHTILIRTLNPPEAGCCLKEHTAGFIFVGRCTVGRHSWAARNTDYNVSTQHLQKCAWLIPDVFKIQTAFSNLDGASEGNKTDGEPILPSQYLPKLLYFPFYYLTGKQEWCLLLLEGQATFLPSLQKWGQGTPSWHRAHALSFHLVTLKLAVCPSSTEPALGLLFLRNPCESTCQNNVTHHHKSKS